MSKVLVHGGKILNGEVEVQGSKNAALPIMAAALLAEHGVSEIDNVPDITDVQVMSAVLNNLGARVLFADNVLTIDAGAASLSTEPPAKLVGQMRAVILVMGALLARCGQVSIAMPGGCAIGSRPIDLHLKALRELGAEITLDYGIIHAQVDGKLKGAFINLDFPSVGATENAMIAAALAEGDTVIENAAKEPEVVDLANFLNRMGADIKGAGTERIEISGVERLTGVYHEVIPDRVEAATYLLAATATHGKVKVDGVIPKHLQSLLAKLREMGVDVAENGNSVTVDASGAFKATDIKTAPYPGFHTDTQALILPALLVADGTSIIVESVFENRFVHIEEFVRSGAQVQLNGNMAVVEGGFPLTATTMHAEDVRSAAALVILALVIDGESEIDGVEHIERGYEDLFGKLAELGADIEAIVEF